MTYAQARTQAATLGFTLTKRLRTTDRLFSALRGEESPAFVIPERHQTFATLADVARYLASVRMVRDLA